MEFITSGVHFILMIEPLYSILKQLLNTMKQIKWYWKQGELFFIRSAYFFNTHYSGIYSDCKVAFAFINKVIKRP